MSAVRRGARIDELTRLEVLEQRLPCGAGFYALPEPSADEVALVAAMEVVRAAG